MSKEKQSSLYSGKVMLAPMVRVCSLPMRLLALDYGADLVYTEEIIDRKLLICHEYKNGNIQIYYIICIININAFILKTVRKTIYIKAVSNAVSIPVIANGGSKNISNLSEVESFRLNTEASSVMLARAAMWNCSVFRRDGPLPFIDVLKSYLRYAFLYDNNVMNTKYCVLQIIHDKMTEIPEADLSLSAKSLQEFADIWHLQEDYRVILHERQQKEMELSAAEGGDCRGVKKKKTENGLELIELPVRYDK
uniref:DUS-like FMN-binding domain-containing protein n=1 Tax=Biomphalaria glabrata TaxID=6526 RepID=A0A2C9L861_BIOGL